MANHVTESSEVELPEAVLLRGVTEPMAAVAPVGPASAEAPMLRRTYYLTRWTLVNDVLDRVDALTNGRAGVLQRLFTYLLIGGTAALVNLAILSIMLYKITWPANQVLHDTLANLAAYEISIFANFIPNDRITFSRLPGHSRSWLARCGRFHVTSIGGVIVTYALWSTLHYLVGLPPLVAQAIALIIAVVFNFTFHHLFTYRHVAPAAH